MNDPKIHFLDGVAADKCLAALSAAAGQELVSGKFLSPVSSSALAVNCFGWFFERPDALPALPGLEDLDWPARSVEIESQMRFPWARGRHPWLDAAIETDQALVGIEAKRFEPYRDTKIANFSDTYDRDVWGDGLEPYAALRDRLKTQPRAFSYLDAAQLVKHALGLATQASKRGKVPVLYYLFAEPAMLAGKPISSAVLGAHRAEIAAFADAVAGSRVRFAAASYRDWFGSWSGESKTHADALLKHFEP